MRVFLVVLSLCAWTWGQAGCTPKGSTYTESFGDDSTLCGFSDGSTKCSNNWQLTQGAAGSVSVVASPNSPPASTACNYSAEFITGTGNTYIQDAGYIPTIPSATAFDVDMYINVKSTGLGAFNAQTLYIPSSDASAALYPCRLEFHSTSGGTIAIRAQEPGTTTTTDSANLSLNAWHRVQLHVTPTTCNAIVDAVSTTTITPAANSVIYQTMGSNAGNLQTIDYLVGYLDLSAAVGGGGPPFVYCDFENSTNGTTATTVIAAAGCHIGNGTWTQGGAGPASALTVATAAQQTLLTPITLGSTIYTDTGTRGWSFNSAASVSDYLQYTWTAQSDCASAGFWYTTQTAAANADAGFYSSMVMGNGLGSDFVAVMYSGFTGARQLYLETNANPNGNPDVGSKFTATVGTKYWITYQMQKYTGTQTKHSMMIFDQTGALLSFQQKAAQASNPSQPNNLKVGFGGDTQGSTPGAFQYDNLVIDYNTCIFPLGPKFTADSLVTGPAIITGPAALE